MKLLQSGSLRAGDPIHFSLTLEQRDAICLRCPLNDCVGVEHRECPIWIEQRRIWREKNRSRQQAGYFAQRDEKIKAARHVTA